MEVFAGLKDALRLVECRECGLRFTNPRPSPELLTRFYSGDTYTCHESAGSSSAGSRADFILDRIERLLPKGVTRKLLDFGAGGGGFIRHAIGRGWEAVGYEPGRRGLESCRLSGLSVTNRLSDLPVGEFNLITLHSVFEHVPDAAATLADIRPLLAPEGRLFIMVPNTGSLRARLALPILSRRFGVDERHRAFPIHLTYYSSKTLCRTLKCSGFEVIDTFTVGMGLDEFWVRSSDGVGSESASHIAKRTAEGGRKLRHRIRDAFLRLGLGESVATVSCVAGR